MDVRLSQALKRLREWIKPDMAGDPSMRMVQIWVSPLQMRNDIELLIKEVEKIN